MVIQVVYVVHVVTSSVIFTLKEIVNIWWVVAPQRVSALVYSGESGVPLTRNILVAPLVAPQPRALILGSFLPCDATSKSSGTPAQSRSLGLICGSLAYHSNHRTLRDRCGCCDDVRPALAFRQLASLAS